MKIILASAVALLCAPAQAAVVLWDNLAQEYERYIPELTAQMPQNCRIDQVFKDMRHDRVEAIVHCKETEMMAALRLSTEAGMDDLGPSANWIAPTYSGTVTAAQQTRHGSPQTGATQATLGSGPLLGGSSDAAIVASAQTNEIFAASTDEGNPEATNFNAAQEPLSMVSGEIAAGQSGPVPNNNPVPASVPLPASLWLLLAGVFAMAARPRA